jgi:ABC-2 type transport system ATP-binding protein
MYDEAYLGMDAALRKEFIDEILDDYMRNPRTVIFSTHYADEMERLFGEVMVLDEGRLLVHEDCDDFRQKGVTLSGEAAVVDAFAANGNILRERTLGNQKELTLFGNLSEKERSDALSRGLTLATPQLQELFIFMTEKKEAGDE